MMKTCIWIWTMRCTWEQKWTTSSVRVHDYSILLKYNSWKTKFEQKGTQIFTNLMLSLENPRLAANMLTGNWSMFLETDGSLAWLYDSPLVHSPLHTMSQCYDRISTLYEGQMQIADPITRQTHPAANLQNCTDRIKNLFQFDMDQENSWYTLTLGIVH